MRAWWSCLTALLALSLASASVARAAGPQPISLHVDGGEDNWHPERAFALRWSNPAGVAGVHYRLLDPAGDVALGERTLDWPATQIQSVQVPGPPGAYTAEVWLEAGDGSLGPSIAAKLRFDDTAPGSVEPGAVTDWIGRTAFPYTIQLGEPAGSVPPSGIRGYAISVDSDASGSPCVGGVCSDEEIDLRGGAGENRIAIGELPEGTRYLHAVAVSGSGVRSATPATTILRIDKTDPVTHLDGAPSGWSNRPLALTATAADGASGMAPSGAGPAPFTAIRIDGEAPIIAAGNAVSAAVIGSGVHTVACYARDAAGNVADGSSANGQPNHAPVTVLVRIDGNSPQIAFAGAQDPLDPELIEARAADPLSGLDRSRGDIGVRRSGSGERFSSLPTEVSRGTLQARWDSEAYPPGEYEFRAVAYDQAGNFASTLSRVNGEAMRLWAPLKAATKLVTDFRPRTLGYGRGTRFGGRLMVGRHAPLAGMSVRIVERFDPGADPRERVSTLTTDAKGAFETYLKPGPSREIVAVAPATATMRGASSQPLRLTARGHVGLRISAPIARVGGKPVVFAGKVGAAGARIPSAGKLVELQFRLSGLPWREFRTVHTNPRGRFRYAYRFADDDSRGVRFQFRAVTPAQTNWPYLPAKSSPVDVRGR